jgi:hypothetical protein
MVFNERAFCGTSRKLERKSSGADLITPNDDLEDFKANRPVSCVNYKSKKPIESARVGE